MRRPQHLDQAWFRSRIALGSTELGRRLLTRGPGADRRKSVGPRTAVCVDGFPRSGNTFATQAFREWNPGVPIAHHTHLPGQLTASVQRSIPTALLIRDPADAVASLIAFNGGRFSAGAGLAAYCAFHRSLSGVFGRLVVCPFERFITDPGELVDALNRRFGAGFHRQALDGDERAALAARIERMQRNHGHAPSTLSVPGQERAAMRREAREEVLADRRLGPARDLYERISAAARSG